MPTMCSLMLKFLSAANNVTASISLTVRITLLEATALPTAATRASALLHSAKGSSVKQPRFHQSVVDELTLNGSTVHRVLSDPPRAVRVSMPQPGGHANPKAARSCTRQSRPCGFVPRRLTRYIPRMHACENPLAV